MSVRPNISVLTFQSRKTSRARIRMPARTATSMIHQGTPVCCATVGSGDTVNITCNQQPHKGKIVLDPALVSSQTKKDIYTLEVFSDFVCFTYISVRSSQNDVFTLTVKDK